MSNSIGQILRANREAKGLLLREVAADMKMDTALLSKFERDDRKPNKEQVYKFARYYHVNPDEMLVAWLSDKIAGEVRDEELAGKALKVAEKKVELLKKIKK